MHNLTISTANEKEFLYDSDKIEHVGGALTIKTSAAVKSNVEDMSADTNFTYDNSLIEFVGGLAKLKDQRPNADMFYASFNQANANYGQGSLIPVLSNSAVLDVANQKFGASCIDLEGTTSKYVTFNGNNLDSFANVFTARIQVNTAYSGTPAAKRTFLFIGNEADQKNSLELFHDSISGNLQAEIYDKDGVLIALWDFGAFAPVAGTYQHLELVVDLDTAESRLFVDGTQLGATMTETGTRDNVIEIIRLGSDSAGTASADSYIDELELYPTALHVADFAAPAAEQVQTVYDITSPSITLNAAITDASTISAWTNFVATVAEINAGQAKTVVSNDGGATWYYFNVANNAFEVSAGAAQSSDVDDINANIADFAVGSGLQYRIYLKSDGNTTATVSNVSVGYTVSEYYTDNPAIKLAAPILASNVESLTVTTSTPDGSAVKYSVLVNNTEYFYNTTTSAWEEVVTPYTDANTDLQDIENNIDTLIVNKSYFNLNVYLNSEDGLARPSVSGLAIDYIAEASVPDQPQRCRVYGQVLDGSTGAPQSGVTVSVKLSDEGVYSNGYVISTNEKSIVTDSDGKWEFSLIDSVNQSPANNPYTFTFAGPGMAIQENKIVPAQAEASYTELS